MNANEWLQTWLFEIETAKKAIASAESNLEEARRLLVSANNGLHTVKQKIHSLTRDEVNDLLRILPLYYSVEDADLDNDLELWCYYDACRQILMLMSKSGKIYIRSIVYG